MRTDRRLLFAAVLWAAALLPACSSKSPVEPPVVPVVPTEPLVGRTLGFTTEAPARAVVRYGLGRDAEGEVVLDHVAYPSAVGRRDRAYATEHSIDLLDLREGGKVYYQVGVEGPGSTTPVFSALDSAVASVGPAEAVLTSTMIHIGFGDSHLLTMPTSGQRVLIDAGERGAATSVRSYLAGHGVARIDCMLATHVHIDHIGGILGYDGNGVLSSHTPAVYYDSPEKVAGAAKYAFEELGQQLDGLFLDPTILRRFDSSEEVESLRWDPQVDVLVLNSGTPEDYEQVDYEGTNINNESMVLRISYGAVDFVIGGDAEREAETSMRTAFADRDITVEYYKASHHGLSDASSGAWVDFLRPRVAFIPNTDLVWDGSLESALASTEATLRGAGTHVYAIDDLPLLGRERPRGIQNNVTFATDGISYEIRTERADQPVPTKMASTAACVRHDPDLSHLFPREAPAPDGDRQE